MSRTFNYTPYPPNKPRPPEEYVNQETVIKTFNEDNKICGGIISQYYDELLGGKMYFKIKETDPYEEDSYPEVCLYKTDVVINKHFKSEMKLFNQAMIKYNKEFAIYEKDIKEWGEWDLQRQIDEVEKQLRTLKKSGPKIDELEKTLAKLKKK